MTVEKALNWAKKQSGKYVQPCKTAGCKYNQDHIGDMACTTPNPIPEADDVKRGDVEDGHSFWNFYCMRFVRSCYGASAEFPKAENMYQILKQKNLIKVDADIPLGALVFWHWSTFGHIGIYTGNGKVIHTGVNPALKKKGIRESVIKDVTEVLNVYNKAEKISNSYNGWANPPVNWLASI